MPTQHLPPVIIGNPCIVCQARRVVLFIEADEVISLIS